MRLGNMSVSKLFELVVVAACVINAAIAFTPASRGSPFFRSNGSVVQLAGGKGFGNTVRKDKKSEAPTVYPPMSQEEIEKWMGHIPVYAVTDPDGTGQAIRLRERTAFYFFMSPIMAEAYRNELQNSTGATDLTVSGLFLGKIWFNILHAEVADSDVEYRLVPDPRDLMSARTLLTEDSDVANEDVANEEKESTPQFNRPYNDIPLFCVDNMPLTNQNEKVKAFLNKMVSSSYMFFSSHSMFDVLDKISGDGYDETKDDLMSLHEVVELMQKEGTIDIRNTVLVPPTPLANAPLPDSLLAEQLADPTSFTARNFFIPLFQE